MEVLNECTKMLLLDNHNIWGHPSKAVENAPLQLIDIFVLTRQINQIVLE